MRSPSITSTMRPSTSDSRRTEPKYRITNGMPMIKHRQPRRHRHAGDHPEVEDAGGQRQQHVGTARRRLRTRRRRRRKKRRARSAAALPGRNAKPAPRLGVAADVGDFFRRAAAAVATDAITSGPDLSGFSASSERRPRASYSASWHQRRTARASAPCSRSRCREWWSAGKSCGFPFDGTDDRGWQPGGAPVAQAARPAVVMR